MDSIWVINVEFIAIVFVNIRCLVFTTLPWRLSHRIQQRSIPETSCATRRHATSPQADSPPQNKHSDVSYMYKYN